MKQFATTVALSIVLSASVFAQGLQSTDTVAIERAAAEYAVRLLPQGDVGFDGTAFDRLGRTSTRPISRVDALARAFGAREVRTDSVIMCSGDPSTCRMSVAALVRMGEPYASNQGARVVVSVRRRSGGEREPIQRISRELILSKEGGAWRVVGIGRVNSS